MIPVVLGNLFLILSLVILFTALYYLIERVSGELIANDCRRKKCDSGDFESWEDVKHAAKKSGGCKGSGVHFILSKQSQGYKKRSEIRAGKQPFTHGFVR